MSTVCEFKVELMVPLRITSCVFDASLRTTSCRFTASLPVAGAAMYRNCAVMQGTAVPVKSHAWIGASKKKHALYSAFHDHPAPQSDSCTGHARSRAAPVAAEQQQSRAEESAELAPHVEPDVEST